MSPKLGQDYAPPDTNRHGAIIKNVHASEIALFAELREILRVSCPHTSVAAHETLPIGFHLSAADGL
jgi:hypothetical protein